MGLMDILNGLQNGPGGQQQPGKGGMSPVTMALLGLLAYKAFKQVGGSQPGNGQPDAPAQGAGLGGLGGILGGLFGGGAGAAAGTAAGSTGSLGNLLQGGLGSLLGSSAGGADGSTLSNGLNQLIKGFQDTGHGKVAQSWVGSGPNQPVSPNDLEKALGSDAIDTLTQQTGMGREQLLANLSQHLPNLVDQLTPNGRMPTAEEASRML